MNKIILVAFVAVAIAHASVIAEEDEIVVDKRFFRELKKIGKKVVDKVTDKTKKIGDKFVDAFKDAGDGIVTLTVKAGENIVETIQKTFKKSAKNGLTKIVTYLFVKESGDYIGPFIYNDKTVGHFFSQVINGVTHIKVFNDDAMQDFLNNYKIAKDRFRRVITILFNSFLRSLINQIDSSSTNQLCAETAGKFFKILTGKPVPRGDVGLAELVCKTAFQYIRMEPDREITVVEEKV